MAFKGWMVKFGDTVLPNSYLQQYRETPNQRLEIDAYRDAEFLLHRETSSNYKSKIIIPIRKLCLGEKIVLKAITDSGIISEVERKVNATYWNSEDMDYRSGVFYMPDIEYIISNVNNRKLDVIYEPFEIQLIEY